MHRISKSNFRFLALFSLALIITGIIIVNSQSRARSDFFVLATFAINIVVVYFNLVNSVKEHQFSFDVMFWLFSFFFFCIAPLLQYLSGRYAWNLDPTDTEVLRTNLFLTIWFIFYLVGRHAGRKRIRLNHNSFGSQSNIEPKEYSYTIDQTALNILLAVALFIVAYYLIRVGFRGMIVRSTNVDSEIDSKAIGLLTNHGFHNALTFIAALHILDAKRNHIKITTIIAVLCFFIGCFPTGISRNMMASFYAGMLIIVFDSARKKRWITWAIFAGLILIFPAISLFRHLSTLQSVSAGQYILSSIQNTYLTGDYDAHQMFISIQRWVQRDGFSWGHQLLGAIFFFVPRSIWPTKALGTGQTAFTVLQQHWYTNVSAPIPSEGYVNFGIPGIIVFALITGYLTHRADIGYWDDDNPLSRIRVIYPFSMLMFFFVCRGDLQSTGSYFLAQIIVGWAIYSFAVRKRRIR